MLDSAAVDACIERYSEGVFDEPWQAQVMAVAFTPIERGAFSNARWSEALGAEIAAATGAGAPDGPQTYHRAALDALEALLSESGWVRRSCPRGSRHGAGRCRAYLNTPHGQPVELRAAGVSRRAAASAGPDPEGDRALGRVTATWAGGRRGAQAANSSAGSPSARAAHFWKCARIAAT